MNSVMGETNLQTLIRSMLPYLNGGDYVFCSLQELPANINDIIFCFRETEDYTVVCSQTFADLHRYSYKGLFGWITLKVHSSLEAVGLTAAFSKVLAENNISCNVVAGYFHDHIFVPKLQASLAIQVLETLTQLN